MAPCRCQEARYGGDPLKQPVTSSPKRVLDVTKQTRSTFGPIVFAPDVRTVTSSLVDLIPFVPKHDPLPSPDRAERELEIRGAGGGFRLRWGLEYDNTG